MSGAGGPFDHSIQEYNIADKVSTSLSAAATVTNLQDQYLECIVVVVDTFPS